MALSPLHTSHVPHPLHTPSLVPPTLLQVVMAVFSYIYYNNYVAKSAHTVAAVMSATLRLTPPQQVGALRASACMHAHWAGSRAAHQRMHARTLGWELGWAEGGVSCQALRRLFLC